MCIPQRSCGAPINAGSYCPFPGTAPSCSSIESHGSHAHQANSGQTSLTLYELFFRNPTPVHRMFSLGFDVKQYSMSMPSGSLRSKGEVFELSIGSAEFVELDKSAFVLHLHCTFAHIFAENNLHPLPKRQ